MAKVALKHSASFQNYRSRITSATIMKPCGRHGGYKVARRWVPTEMLRGGGQGGGRADAFGCQSTGTPQGRQNFLLLLRFYFVLGKKHKMNILANN